MIPEQIKGWRRLNGQRIEIPIKDAVKETIIRETAAGHRLKVCIGTDSQVRGEMVEFATVIVFLREKKGGFMFIRNGSMKQKVGLRERMILEVAKSVETAYALCDLLEVGQEAHGLDTRDDEPGSPALEEAQDQRQAAHDE